LYASEFTWPRLGYTRQVISTENERMDRIAMLQEILDQSPDDAFARYGLALEYSNSGQTDQALAQFGTLLTKHPDYTAGYFMAAQTLAKAERTDEAKKMLTDGIASARRTGNQHALSEMEAMLETLPE
jgi:predicted Zn-dependent protease